MKSPIIFIIYNRPDLTRIVFNEISKYRPEKLFIIADGPKNTEDKVLCDQTRAIINSIQWDCDVHKIYSDVNLGCGKRISTGITQAFKNCDRAIILEDDCLPEPSFFPFCDALLERFENDTRIGMISGNNHGYNLYDPLLSYSFSKHGKIWGWATWRRAWDMFDFNLDFLSEKNINLIKSNISDNENFVAQWWKGVDSVLGEKLDTWDYQWGVSRYANNLLTIRPKVNLVANIGFGVNATHTRGLVKKSYLSTEQISFPLIHPELIFPDYIADGVLENQLFLNKSKGANIKSKFLTLFNKVNFIKHIMAWFEKH